MPGEVWRASPSQSLQLCKGGVGQSVSFLQCELNHQHLSDTGDQTQHYTYVFQ